MVAQKRVAIYARVSTVDKGQTPETQLLTLRAYAAHRGFVVAGEYIDYASGTRTDRAQYQALLAAARQRQIDVVLVWRYDRFARSTQALVQALKEFHSLGVDFISYALSTAFLKNGHKAYPFSYNWLREQPCIAESGMQTSLREQAPAKAHFSRVCRPVSPWSYGQKHDGFQLNVHF